MRVVEARFGDIVERKLEHKSWLERPRRSRSPHQLRNDSDSSVASSTTRDIQDVGQKLPGVGRCYSSYCRSESIYSNTMYANMITKIGASAINRSRSSAENRYVEGPFSEVVKDLKTDATGALSVGPDGVLRSFAGNLEVIDYRQLDPEQVRWFGKQQLSAWSNDAEIPESVSALVQGTIDGRLVTDETILLHPSEKPQIGKKSSSTQSEKRSADDLFIRQSALCAGTTCGSLNDCIPRGCNACYFPNGPPDGRCLDPNPNLPPR